MISGIGVDIAEIRRFTRAYIKFGQRFPRRILCAAELLEFPHARNPGRYLAMRFAAKEAASKALGTGFKQGVTPRQFRVIHASSGQPSLEANGRAAELFVQRGINTSHLSLSDDAGFAMAFVVLETTPRNGVSRID